IILILILAVKMATGSGWQQQQYYCPAAAAAAGPGSKFSAPSSASSLQSAGIAAMEYTQDLHLKMSKKIAQLTKQPTGSVWRTRTKRDVTVLVFFLEAMNWKHSSPRSSHDVRVP
ncbi:putative protein FAM184A, partial [Scophthalmus maximus]